MNEEKLKKEFEKYLKDSSDYYDPREPLTERKLLQMWLDCAEPREKRIAELEDKLANADYQLEGRDNEIAKLEKENAELKLKLEALEGQTPWKDIKGKSEAIGKLTKAKEIIKDLLDTQYRLDPYRDIFKDRIAEAEAFLNSEVEK